MFNENGACMMGGCAHVFVFLWFVEWNGKKITVDLKETILARVINVKMYTE